jgi:uncharacterized membrane protein
MHGIFGGMGGGWFLWFIVIGLVALIVFRVAGVKQCGFSRSETPEEVLKRRYTEGKITKEQYEETLRNLK